MGESRIWICSLCIILASLSLNIYLATNLAVKVDKMQKQKLRWSRQAAEEAEAVASISCSGHGRAYLDGLVEDGKPVCECNNCYGGPDCSQFNSSCPAYANRGDPLFLEPFWVKNAASSAVLISGWHRMSYSFPDRSYISEQLANHLRKLHSVAKNAVTEGKYIVYGTGSTQLLSAAAYALSDDVYSPARVVVRPPFFPLYRMQAEYFDTSRFQFDESLLPNASRDDDRRVIEFVTSPNNPDGKLRRSDFEESPNVKTIYDHAYYWPHYSAIPAPADEDLMIFTLSKLTGHAGSRFGWALVKDKRIYDNMVDYMLKSTIGTSQDTQLRTLQLLKTALRGNGTNLFQFAHTTMTERWRKLNDVVSRSSRFSLQEIPPQFCSFFERVRGPSPAYAWVKCEREEDYDCTQVFRAAKIIGVDGRRFYSDSHYVRLSLIRSNDYFDLLLKRLKDLVNGAYSFDVDNINRDISV